MYIYIQYQLFDARKLSKQFGPRSGQTEYRSCPSPRLFEIMIVFLNDILKKTALIFFNVSNIVLLYIYYLQTVFVPKSVLTESQTGSGSKFVWHSKAKRKICLASDYKSKNFRVGTCR